MVLKIYFFPLLLPPSHRKCNKRAMSFIFSLTQDNTTTTYFHLYCNPVNACLYTKVLKKQSNICQTKEINIILYLYKYISSKYKRYYFKENAFLLDNKRFKERIENWLKENSIFLLDLLQLTSNCFLVITAFSVLWIIVCLKFFSNKTADLKEKLNLKIKTRIIFQAIFLLFGAGFQYIKHICIMISYLIWLLILILYS